MTPLLVLLFASLGSVGAVTGAAVIILTERKLTWIIGPLVGYATGTLLGGALLGMMPTALERSESRGVWWALLGGLLLFFVLERLVLWRHSHAVGHEAHRAPGELILIGDAVHNLMDGIVIGAAFAESTALGISTSLAVIAHEVPQEVGDFAILLKSGYSRARALAYDILSSTTTIPAAIAAYYAFGAIEDAIPFVLAIAAASFLYIALADLVPQHHESRTLRSLPTQLLPILAGIATIAIVGELGS